MKVLDLFSGIGGFSLGLERAGMKTVAFCEIEPFCRAVLRKHWPEVPIYDDVRELTADALRGDGIAVDAICGGFPCQDLSLAGDRAGLKGARSGLWGEYARLIGELRPQYVIVENVPGLLSLGMGTVLGDLAALGFDAWWDCIPASAVGAPHQRDRVWIVAHSVQPRRSKGRAVSGDRSASGGGSIRGMADANGGDTRAEREQPGRKQRQQPQDDGTVRLGNAEHRGREGRHAEGQRTGAALPSGEIGGPGAFDGFWRAADWLFCTDGKWRPVEPGTFPLAHGVPARVAKCRSAGNAVLPLIPEIIGRAILAAEARP